MTAIINRISVRDSDPTGGLAFRVIFTEPVDISSIQPEDFEVTGGSSATVLSVRQVNSDTDRIDVFTSDDGLDSFTGSVGIGLSSSATITTTSDGNNINIGESANPSGGSDTVTLDAGPDTTAPSITSIVRQTPGDAITNEDTLTFRVTFDEDVQAVDASDFAVNGTTTATVTGVTLVSNSVYDVTVSGGDLANFDGPVGLDLAAGQNITDLASNALPAGEPATDEVYTVVSTVPPLLTDVERQIPATEATSNDTLVFRVTFSEAVQNVDVTDFDVQGGTTAGVTTVVAADASNTVYTVTVSGGDLATFNGSVSLVLNASQDITNLTNTALIAAPPTGNNESYIVDVAAPAFTSIQRQTPAAATTSDDTLIFQATFSEDVQEVDASDFAINGTTTATVTNVNRTSAGVYDITVSGGDLADFNGSVGLDLAAGQNITDLAGNSLPAGEPATDEFYTVDNTTVRPLLTNIERQTPATETTNDDTLVFRVTFSEAVQAIDAADFVVESDTTAGITGFTAADASNAVYDVTVSGGDLATFNGAVRLTLAANQDITNLTNVALLTAAPTGSNESYTVANDVTPPALTSIRRQTPATETTSDDTLIFQAIFSEDVQNVNADDFSIDGTTTATITDVTAVNNSTYNITVSGGDLASLNGTVGLNLAANQNITDLIGNALPVGEPATDEAYTLSNTTTPTTPTTPTALLTPFTNVNVLEVTELGDRPSLNLTFNTIQVSTVSEIKVFTTDANGGNRTQVDSVSLLQPGLLPATYSPSFNLTNSVVSTGTYLQFELEENGVTRVATLNSVNTTEVSLDFGNGTTLNGSLATTAPPTNLLKGDLSNDASHIDLSGQTGDLNVRFTVYREAQFNNTVDFYVTDTADGGITDPITGQTLRANDTGYKEAALSRRLSLDLSGQNGQATTIDKTITGGGFLGMFIILDSSTPSAAVDNVFFSHLGSSTNTTDYIKQLGNNTIGFEDRTEARYRDFNDFVVEYEFV